MEGIPDEEPEVAACDLGQVPSPLGVAFSCLKMALTVSLQLHDRVNKRVKRDNVCKSSEKRIELYSVGTAILIATTFL